MTDEKYVFIKDSAEKKRNARGYYQKNRTGKGRVRFPDDNLTRKEKASLSKDLGIYKMGEPVYWKEFRTWPEEFQKEYFEKLDERFNVGNAVVGKMMEVGEPTIRALRKNLGIPRPRGGNAIANAQRVEKFENWIRTFRGPDPSEIPYKTVRAEENEDWAHNTSDRPYIFPKPSQIEKFEKRYSGSKDDNNDPPQKPKKSGKPAIAMIEQNVKFVALDPGANAESIVNQFRAFMTHFTSCEMIEITIKTVETRKD